MWIRHGYDDWIYSGYYVQIYMDIHLDIYLEILMDTLGYYWIPGIGTDKDRYQNRYQCG